MIMLLMMMMLNMAKIKICDVKNIPHEHFSGPGT